MKFIKHVYLPAIFAIALSQFIFGQVKVSSIFTDNMVLQKGIEIPVWGTGEPGTSISINIHDQTVGTAVKPDGTWKTDLKPEGYGGPYTLKIISTDTIKLKNVMIGEVWFCSGQSNMEMPVGDWGRVKNYKNEIKEAAYDSIRLLFIPPTLATEPEKEVKNPGWKICSPENIDKFSAVAYFFGRELYKKLRVPIGLIDVTKGGTPIESWMKKSTLKDYSYLKRRINFVSNSSKAAFDSMYRAYKHDYLNWLGEIREKDQGYTDSTPWYKIIDISDWDSMKIPSVWENEGLPGYDGVVWFKKDISLPDGWLNHDLVLSLGPIQDYDITYFNGVKIGEQKKRDLLSVYNVPGNLVDKNNCEITVRILDNYGIGGIWGNPNDIYLQNEKGEKIFLSGDWKYKPTVDINKEGNQAPKIVRLDRLPTVLFNGMVSPVIPFGVRGILWYQGESNAERAFQYRSLFPEMIKSWRYCWNDDSLPFYFVQIANYKEKEDKPSGSSWAELREAQSLALELKNTGMAVTIDIGDAVNVHYKNKEEVGRRLALIALNKNYGSNVEYSGPMFDNYKIEGNKIRIYFKHSEGLKTGDGKPPVGFAVCGKNKKFYWANAEIDNNSVLVWSDKIKVPAAVRFEWASNPDCNLYNAADLPAAPFRTDDYPLITEKK